MIKAQNHFFLSYFSSICLSLLIFILFTLFLRQLSSPAFTHMCMDVGLLTGSMGSMWFRPHAGRKCIQLPLCLYDCPIMPGQHCCIVVFGYFWLFLLTSTRYLSHGKRRCNTNVSVISKYSLVFSLLHVDQLWVPVVITIHYEREATLMNVDALIKEYKDRYLEDCLTINTLIRIIIVGFHLQPMTYPANCS